MSAKQTAAVNNAADQKQPLQQALDALQSTATQFAAACMNDASVRAQYMVDIHTVSVELTHAVHNGTLTEAEATERINKLRSRILELL